ncbi:MAG: AAA family ATPase [Planctomycetota bacterium]
MELFESCEKPETHQRSGHPESPLADRMRPQNFNEFIGQEEIIGPNKPLRKIITTGKLPSLIFWGPPGSGKTTLAFLMARATKFEFITFSAVISGIKEIKEVMERAKYNREKFNRRTILFVDEIHRFNKAQQDAFLPYVEKGLITLIGATTENPSFELNSALLSRCRVFVLRGLTENEIKIILQAALRDKKKGLGGLAVEITDQVLSYVINMANAMRGRL